MVVLENVPTFEAELSQLNNISWTGVWDTNLRGCRDQQSRKNLAETTDRCAIYRCCGSCTLARHNSWFNGPHDPFDVINFNSTPAAFEFETETTCSIEPAIVEPVSIIESASFVSVRITTAAGVVGVWEDYTHKLTSGLNSISYRAGGPVPRSR